MKKSLVFLKVVNVETDKYKRIYTEDGRMHIEQDVAFIRYRFDKFGEEELAFINRMKNLFINSTHLVEVKINEEFNNSIQNVESIENTAIFLYLDISDDDVENGLSANKVELLSKVENCEYDRIMMKDKTENLCVVSANKLKNSIADLTGCEADSIGICSSSLSFLPANSCLSAVYAREIAAIYNTSDSPINPSANHESMTSCGCIQHILISDHLRIDESKKEKNANIKQSSNNEDGSKKEKKAEPKKVSVPVFSDF